MRHMLRRSDIDETERLEDIDCPSCNVREPQGGPCIMEDEAENGYTEVKISLAVSHQVRPRQLALPSVSLGIWQERYLALRTV